MSFVKLRWRCICDRMSQRIEGRPRPRSGRRTGVRALARTTAHGCAGWTASGAGCEALRRACTCALFAVAEAEPSSGEQKERI